MWAIFINYTFLNMYSSSRPEVFNKKDVLRNFAIFTGKNYKTDK